MLDDQRQRDERALSFTHPQSDTMRQLLRDNMDHRSRSVMMFVIYHFLTDRNISVKDISAAFGVSKPTTARICRELETQGWIERQPDPTDGRRILLRPHEEIRTKLLLLWPNER